MSSVPPMALAHPVLRTVRYALITSLLAGALSGCAIWPKALTWGQQDPAAPTATAQPVAPPPAAPAVVEELPALDGSPVPTNTADTAPLEAHSPMVSTPVMPPPDAVVAKAPAKAKGTSRDKAAGKAHAGTQHQAKPKVHAAAAKSNGGDLVPGFYINVGLFAVPSNGTNAYRTLEKAELPVFTDVVKSKKGALTRVRVGPYLNQALADAAADKIKGMKLEAVVFQH